MNCTVIRPQRIRTRIARNRTVPLGPLRSRLVQHLGAGLATDASDGWHAVPNAAFIRMASLLGPRTATVDNRQIVFWRGTHNRLVAMDDACVHRAAPLSAGQVSSGDDGVKRLVCCYHHWSFTEDGRIANIPTEPEGRWPKRCIQKTYEVSIEGWDMFVR